MFFRFSSLPVVFYLHTAIILSSWLWWFLNVLGFLQLEYLETILNPYFTTDARESLKSLQGLLLEKATESVTDAVDNPGHNRRPTRGSEDAVADDRQQATTVSPDELIVSNLTLLLLYYMFRSRDHDWFGSFDLTCHSEMNFVLKMTFSLCYCAKRKRKSKLLI